MCAAVVGLAISGCGVRMDGAAAVGTPSEAASGAGSAGSAPVGGAVVGAAPACAEEAANPGPWGRAEAGARGVVTVVAGRDGKELGGLLQGMAGRGEERLRFLGTHLFDILDKLHAEGGATEEERRRVICAALNAVAKSGAPVVRIWGTLKRTGTREELERARDMLALLLDENARRLRPLRFVVTLLNHQPGYGLPDPAESLDDQRAPGWAPRDVYTLGAWRRSGVGQLAERIEVYRENEAIRTSPYVLAWEIVNELDTHRTVAGGSFQGAEAEALRSTFLVPAAAMLAEAFPQPVMLGELRGELAAYGEFAEGVVKALPEKVRARLAWTAHVYVEAPSAGAASLADRARLERAVRKLDLDLDLARKLGLPFVLGEIGQIAKVASRSHCQGGATHDVGALLAGVLSPDPDPHGRKGIEAALFWGEGLCGLEVAGPDGARRTIDVGAGGDSADLGPGETGAREALSAARRTVRFTAGSY